MKLTKKTVKHEVETTETVCEITQEEFDKICAKAASETITSLVDCDVDGVLVAITLTSVLARFSNRLDDALFGETTKTKKTDKKEDK